MSKSIDVSYFEKLPFHQQYTYAHNYLIEVFKEVSISVEYIPFDILNSIIIFVQQKPEVQEREIMHKFMTYPIDIYNFENMIDYYKDIYSSTRAWHILSSLYIKVSDIDDNLFVNISTFVNIFPNATNYLIIQQINQLQNH